MSGIDKKAKTDTQSHYRAALNQNKSTGSNVNSSDYNLWTFMNGRSGNEKQHSPKLYEKIQKMHHEYNSDYLQVSENKSRRDPGFSTPTEGRRFGSSTLRENAKNSHPRDTLASATYHRAPKTPPSPWQLLVEKSIEDRNKEEEKLQREVVKEFNKRVIPIIENLVKDLMTEITKIERYNFTRNFYKYILKKDNIKFRCTPVPDEYYNDVND
ncbi:unnamed protein product [Caenorhabditis bovis]|uniref:Uncharacterized protein n=1 Tax=Caenorhabditis bovis TaxID=2654633 RepID=A0A8S1F2H5_9PELO|nr:unnamed protein product [Caenorhabditis bovis]